MEEVCERKLYITTSTFDLNDKSLRLVTTAVDPHYRLSFFLSELNKKVKKLLQQEVRKYSRRDARQSNDSPTYQQSKSPKQHSSTNFDSKNFLSFYSFEKEEKTSPQENEQQDLTKNELMAEVNGILSTQV